VQRYFDNAATSFPKPEVVLDAMVAYTKNCGASPGRGAYAQAVDATCLLDDCRSQLCEIVQAPKSSNCIFTLNCTDSLNMAINGVAQNFLANGERVHIITTAMDHNSVLRPLSELAKQGVTHTVVPAHPETGIVDPIDIADAITSDTKLVAIAHGSNVTGTIQDLKTIGEACGAIPFLVDAAQTMGHTPIDVEKMRIDLLAFPGHKGLLGPLGTGGLIMKSGIEHLLSPVRTGGTGSQSELPVQPMAMPDKYEAGSHNMVGIAGLVASTRWILDKGVNTLYKEEQSCIQQFLDEMQMIENVRIVGPKTADDRCGVFSLVFEATAPHEIAKILELEYGICARSGLHCAPFAHKTLGTDLLGGTLRISIGPFHTPEDITYLTNAISLCTQSCSV
jgi:cysteine desulfurase / selenocysteine lyase